MEERRSPGFKLAVAIGAAEWTVLLATAPRWLPYWIRGAAVLYARLRGWHLDTNIGLGG